MTSEPNVPSADEPEDASPVAVPPYEESPSSTGLIDADVDDVEVVEDEDVEDEG